MPVNSKAAIVVLILLPLLFALSACGSSRLGEGTQPAEQPESSSQGFAANLPPPSALEPLLAETKQVSYSETDYIRHGKDFDAGLPNQNVMSYTNRADFDTNWSEATGMNSTDLGYCCFTFDNLSGYSRATEVRFGFDIPPTDIGTAWLGLADWDHDYWVWQQCTELGVFAVPSFDPFTSATDHLVAIVVMANAEKNALRWMRLGPPLVSADLIANPGHGIPPFDVTLDASGSTEGVTTGTTYNFDLDDDGDFEAGSMSPSWDLTVQTAGQHRYTLCVRTSYGIEATASTTVNSIIPWAHSWGGSDNEQIEAVITDGEEFIYAVGSTRSFGAGAEDLLVLKYDLDGELIWARTWGGSGIDTAEAAVFTDQSIFVVGKTSTYGVGDMDALLQRWDTEGNLTWTRTYGEDDSVEPGLTTLHGLSASGGYLYAAGCHNDTGADSSTLVMKYDLDGNFIWAKQWLDSTWDFAFDIQAVYSFIGQTTGVHVTGQTADKLLYLRYDDEGLLLSSRIWDVIQSSGDCLSVSGIFNEVFIGGYVNTGSDIDVLLINLSNDVGQRWGGDDNDNIRAIKRIGDNLYLCGTTDSFHTSHAGLFLSFTTDGVFNEASLWKSNAANDILSDMCLFPGNGLVFGGNGGKAEGSSWSPTSELPSDVTGSWQDVIGTDQDFDGTETTPTAVAADTTDGIIDTGGGWLDAIVLTRGL